MTTTEIMNKYTSGEATIEEINKELEANGKNNRLDPEKHFIHPDEVHRYGLLNTGWGDLDKVEISLELAHDDMGDAPATCYYMGQLYKVEGKKLVELR